MKLFALSALCTLFLCPIFGGQYVGINAGANNLIITNGSHDGLKVGGKAGLTYGMAFDSNFRVELAASYAENNYKTKYQESTNDVLQSKTYNHGHNWSYMINCLYDVKQIFVQQLHPYFGIGVGYCQNTQKLKVKTLLTTNEVKEKDNRFGYQAIAGVKYPINTDYACAVEYHYLNGQAHAKAHSVGLHLIRNF